MSLLLGIILAAILAGSLDIMSRITYFPHSCSDGDFSCLLLFLLIECVAPGVPLREARGIEL